MGTRGTHGSHHPSHKGSPLLDADVFRRRHQEAEAAREVQWLFDPHAGQQQILDGLKRFTIVCCGRRFGKSLIAIRIAVQWALETGGLVWLCGPTYATAMRSLWAQLIKFLPRQYRKVFRSERKIELAGGGTIQVVSLDNPDNLRGEGLQGCVIDEAAFIPNGDYAIEQVIRPMLLQTRGRLLAISTPDGRRGWFYRWFLRGQSGDRVDQDYAAFQMPSWTNPTIPAEEWDDLRANTPQSVFDQEYGAEFVDSTSQVFRNVQLAAVVKARALVEVGEYYFGIDWARTNDYSVVSVLQKIDETHARQVAVERWNRIADEAQLDRVQALVEKYRPKRVLAEKNSFGAVYISFLRNRGVAIDGFDTTGSSKPPLIKQLAGAFELQRLQILDDETQRNELVSYERQVVNDHETFNAPQGYHDDTVIALALSWRAAFGDPELGLKNPTDHFRGKGRDFIRRRTSIAPPRSDRWATGQMRRRVQRRAA